MTSFEEHQVELLEVIFQKTARPDGSTIQKLAVEMQISSRIVWGWFQKRRKEEKHNFPERERKQSANINSYAVLPLQEFNCIFCEKVISFNIEANEEYESHLKNTHEVHYDHNILNLVNFMDTDEKTDFIETTKKVVKKGDPFLCGLCFDKPTFVVGQFLKFKEHLNLKHNISYEVGLLIAVNLINTEFKTQLINIVNHSLNSNQTQMKYEINMKPTDDIKIIDTKGNVASLAQQTYRQRVRENVNRLSQSSQFWSE